MKIKNSRSILIFLIIIVLVVVIYLVYKNFDFTQIDIYSQTKNWQGYTNTTPAYSLKYPADWKIDSSDANLTGIKEGAKLTISKGDTEFQIISYADSSSALKFPHICQFPDSKYKGNLILGNNYTEIKSKDSVYRIAPGLPTTGWTGSEKVVCFKKNNEEKFTTIVGQMKITYIVPEDYPDTDINTMNLILSTFKFIEK